MAASEDLTAVLDRVARQRATLSDTARLRRLVQVRGDGSSVQLGSHNINLQSGREIRIGDRIYRGMDAHMIREVLADMVHPPGGLRSFGGFVVAIGMVVVLLGMGMFFYGLISVMRGPQILDAPPADVIEGFGIAFLGVVTASVGGLIRGWQRTRRH